MNTLRDFIVDEEGFTGAEKAIFTLLALGVILVIGKVIYDGSKAGATTAFLALFVAMLAGYVVVQAAEQEGAELAA